MRFSLFLLPLFLLTVSFGARLGSVEVDRDVLLNLVNAVREKGCRCGDKSYPPAPALRWSAQLEAAAQGHSEDMARKRYFSHTGSDRSDAGQRLRRAGYGWRQYGENIAMGHETEAAVVAGWVRSPGHCRNIMDPGFTEMGVGRSGAYWTQDFGRR